MGSTILYIELFQPFAQYRNPFTFYYAQTYPLPPKSTVIGMLQNATGRYYDQEFWNLKISVHGGFESIFWNYQQLIKGKIFFKKINEKYNLWNVWDERKNPKGLPLYNSGVKSQRTPVYQQELFNGHLYIFVRGDKRILNEIKEALEFPKKIMCLGRSEDIIFIRKIKFIEEVEPPKPVKKSIWLTYPTYIKQKHKENGRETDFPIKNEKFPVYSIPVKVIFKNNGIPVRNKAEITKNTERDVKFEPVIYTGSDYVIYLKEPIDVEYYKIDDEVFKIPVEYGWL